MLNAFLVALAVFICVGGAELIGFTMLNRPIVIGPLVGLFLGDVKTGVMIGASLEAVFMGVVNIGGASAAEPGIATAVGTAFAIMLGKGSEVALTLALPIGILGLQIKTFLYIFLVGMFAKKFDQLAAEGKEYMLDTFLPEYEDKDIIIGYRADDSYFAFANAFLNNTLSLAQLEKAMYLGKLGEQIVLKSKKAFHHLTFQEAIYAEKETYYPKKMNRDQGARGAFRSERSKKRATDAIYLIDILREEWKNDDARLSGNLSE